MVSIYNLVAKRAQNRLWGIPLAWEKFMYGRIPLVPVVPEIQESGEMTVVQQGGKAQEAQEATEVPEGPDGRVVVANAKGGVGKTTVAANLAGGLAAADRDVLAVDMDPQGNLTEALGELDAYDAEPPTLFDALLEPAGDQVLSELITDCGMVDLVPSSVDLLGAQLDLAAAHMFGVWSRLGERPVPDRVAALIGKSTDLVKPDSTGGRSHGYGLLADSLTNVDDAYDVTVVDAPPGHNIMFKCALFAAPNLVVPATAEATSKGAVERLFDEIEAFEAETGRSVSEVAAVVNRVRPSTNAADDMTAFLSRVFDDLPTFSVPERVALSYAYDAGEPIHQYDPNADVVPTFNALAETVVTTLEGSHE